jgi:vacuolar-type H+-ATPase subunit E/Vma4
MEKQIEFPFIKKKYEEEMKQISEDAKRQLCNILEEIILKREYNEDDIRDIVDTACWIERITVAKILE